MIILLAQILTSWLCYVFSKFACKIQIQNFSFSFPISLTVPVSITLLLILNGLREMNTCAFHGYLDDSDYLFFVMPPVYFIQDFIIKEFSWIWLLTILSQAWITRHIWSPKNDRNASTERLFVTPMYCSLLIDQSLMLNRRREDQNICIKKRVWHYIV